MPTDPKDNRGGDLAEIVDLVGRKPKGTLTRRKLHENERVGSLEKFRSAQARKEIGKIRTVNSSRELFKQRRAMIDWAKQEKADIESGAKKPPATSLEKFMADRDKPLKTALVRETETRTARAEAAATHRSVRARQQTGELSKKFSESQQSTKAFMRLQSAAETGEAQAFVGKMKPGVKARTDLHSINDWAERMEIRREASYEHQHQKPGYTWGHTKTYVKDELFKDLGEKPFNVTSSNPNRLYIDTKSQAVGSRDHAEFSRFVAGEKKLNTPKNPLAGQGDLGEAVSGAAKAQGLRARAEARATRQKRSETRKAAGKGAAGSGPRITETFDDKHDLTQIPGGWGKLRPGDL